MTEKNKELFEAFQKSLSNNIGNRLTEELLEGILGRIHRKITETEKTEIRPHDARIEHQEVM